MLPSSLCCSERAARLMRGTELAVLANLSSADQIPYVRWMLTEAAYAINIHLKVRAGAAANPLCTVGALYELFGALAGRAEAAVVPPSERSVALKNPFSKSCPKPAKPPAPTCSWSRKSGPSARSRE